VYSTGHCCFRSRARRRSQKKGDYHCTSQRDVSTSTPNSTLYYARASFSHWPTELAFTSGRRSGKYISLSPGDSTEKSTASTKYSPSHIMYARLPAFRTIETPTPCLVLSGVSRLTCITLYLSRYTAMHHCTSVCQRPQRAAHPKAKCHVLQLPCSSRLAWMMRTR
jgi:hypothetical protein